MNLWEIENSEEAMSGFACFFFIMVPHFEIKIDSQFSLGEKLFQIA